MATTIESPLSVRDLRRRWKPTKQRLNNQRDNHPTLVRFHRACSWLARVEEMGGEIEYDLALILQWVAFNALYGQWDEGAHEPLGDRECWRGLLGPRLRSRFGRENSLPSPKSQATSTLSARR